jgi:hypothetical protein
MEEVWGSNPHSSTLQGLFSNAAFKIQRQFKGLSPVFWCCFDPSTGPPAAHQESTDLHISPVPDDGAPMSDDVRFREEEAVGLCVHGTGGRLCNLTS